MSEHHQASPSNRAVVNTTISFGLVSVPVKMYAVIGEGKNPVPRNEFTVDGHPVGRQPFDKETGLPVTADQVVKRATASDGTLVEVSDDELAIAAGEGTPGLSEVETFVPLAALFDGTYAVDGYYQARPAPIEARGKKQPNPAAEKAFALLTAALAARQAAALFKVTLRGAPRYGALCPDGRVLLLAFARQVRPAMPVPDVTLSDAELAMAGQLVDAVGISTPVLEDTVGDRLRAFVDSKAQGVVTEVVELPAPAPEVDLLAALQASIDAANRTKAA